MRVSVIIPAKTTAEVLVRCLDSVAVQTYPSTLTQTIVCHTAMADVVASIADRFPTVLFVESPRSGPAAARNHGVGLSDGEIIAFLDVDCIADRNWLARGVESLQSAPKRIGAIGGKVRVTYAIPDHPSLLERYSRIMDFDQKFFIEDLYFSVTANMMTFRSVWNEIGGFDEESFPGYGSEDHDWGLRLTCGAFKTMYVPQMLTEHPAQSSFSEFARKMRAVTKSEAVLRCKYDFSQRPLFARIKTLIGRMRVIWRHGEGGTVFERIGLIGILWYEMFLTRMSM